MKDTLIQLSKGVLKGPAADLVPVLFGERPPTMTKKDVSFSPFNSNLDYSQVLNFIKFSFCKCGVCPTVSMYIRMHVHISYRHIHNVCVSHMYIQK